MYQHYHIAYYTHKSCIHAHPNWHMIRNYNYDPMIDRSHMYCFHCQEVVAHRTTCAHTKAPAMIVYKYLGESAAAYVVML